MNPGVDALIAQVTRANTVDDSVVAFIQGVPGLIQEGIDQALANGATGDQLQPLVDLGTTLSAKTDAIVAAMQPPPPPGPGA